MSNAVIAGIYVLIGVLFVTRHYTQNRDRIRRSCRGTSDTHFNIGLAAAAVIAIAAWPVVVLRRLVWGEK